MSDSSSGRFGGAELAGRWITTERTDTPLVVCLHGGGYDNRYFDVPGRSVLSRISSAGFPAVALTRPGYPADEESARRQPSFAEAAGIVADAITDQWRQWGDGRPGVVILGHSIGGAVALHVAGQARSWPLLGVSVSGIGERMQETVHAAGLPPDIVVTFTFDAVRPHFGPDWTLPDPTLSDAAELLVGTPSADIVEITAGFTEQLPAVARAVDVPVQYVLAEFDCYWAVSDERVDAFARLFSRAPFVDAAIWRGTGHNIEHHRLGEAYVRGVLAFAERCAMEAARPPTDSV